MELLATQIAAAINMRALYPSSHPRVNHSIDHMLTVLQRSLEETEADAITYVLVGDDLLVGDEVIRKSSLSVREFIGILTRRGIERLTLAAGVDFAEAHQFIGALSVGEGIKSSPHIIVGRAHLVIEDEQKEKEKRKELSVQQIEIIRDAWARFRVERKLPMDQLEGLVWSFIDSMARTTRAMLPLASLKEHDEYTFVHSVNVSLLVLAQARSFGLWGSMLHAFGMAALLHDIGKLTIPLHVLNKPGKLEPEEWQIMKSHAQQGAWHLSELDGTPPLSVVVAYEHHLRYDEQPNYPLLRSRRIPNLASRMTAIADTYDAMSTVRPYQEPLGRQAAFDLLRKRSGTFYDPALVPNFIRLVGESVI